MCGFAGIYQYGCPGKPLDGRALERMADSIVHRGPDDSGCFIESDIGLVHRRLSIIDLAGGHQPMTSGDGTATIAYNGEIYNFRELRSELRSFGVALRTHSDTEVLLEGCRRFGMQYVDRLRGMFAFALWERRGRRLYLVRDRLGIKPLYYYDDGKSLIFASEQKALFAFLGNLPDLDIRGISDFLSYRQPLGSRTMYRRIRRLEPGCFLTAAPSGVKVHRYWELHRQALSERVAPNVIVRSLRHQIAECVKLHMLSDVPVGAYLSGGLDSSIIVAAMARHRRARFHTYSIGFREEGFSEFPYSRLVARRFNTAHHEIRMSANQYTDRLLELIHYNDGPLSVPNEVPLYVMSKQLSREITVVLSGEGADECFAGYGRIFRMPFEAAKQQMLSADATSRDISAPGPAPFLDSFLTRYSVVPRLIKEHLLGGSMPRDFGSDPLNKRFFARALASANGLEDDYDRIQWIFIRVHLENLLRRLDITTMAASVEGRVPFADHKIAEFGLNLPVSLKLKWRSAKHLRAALAMNPSEYSETQDITKYLLRKAFSPDLPAEVCQRRKMGFPVPLSRWFTGTHSNWLRGILLDAQARQRGIFNPREVQRLFSAMKLSRDPIYGIVLWMLANLELSFRINHPNQHNWKQTAHSIKYARSRS